MPTPVHRRPLGARQTQQGAVLIIVLIMLGILSMMAATSLHNAQSTESISGSTRNTELASQAADIALRHCTESVKKRMAMKNSGTESEAARYVTSFTEAHITSTDKPPAWHDAAGQWDTPSQYVFVLPLDLLGKTTLYKRAPECMVKSLTATPSDHFIITARGFGPEVAAAGTKGSRPMGTEVWLQTHIDLQTLESPWRQVFLRQPPP